MLIIIDENGKCCPNDVLEDDKISFKMADEISQNIATNNPFY